VNVGVVGVPGGWSTERLARAFRGAGADTVIVDPAACRVSMPDGQLYHRGQLLSRLDGIVVKKIGDTMDGWVVQERINVLRALEVSGVRVWSSPDRLQAAVNRYRMTVELSGAGLPIPATVVTEDVAEAEAAVQQFGATILKPLFTSKGRGMHRLEPGPGLRETLDRHCLDGHGPFYLQRFIKHPGRDLGIAVLDGRYLGAYWRVAAQGQWMTTVLSGGRYERADPPIEAIDIAVRAANRFGLLFTGVDLMETPDGQFVVLEVSAFGGFRGLLETSGIDAAPLVAETVLRRLRQPAA
jgi:ribosomal protein S6--L-glutamate ligase